VQLYIHSKLEGFDIRNRFYMADDAVPGSTVTPAEAPTNSNATTGEPTNYEICERTGFRVKPGTLRREWTGRMVRPESWERRHPQDFVRSKPEDRTGSVRPEQPDQYIEDLYPGGVTAEDL